MLKYATVLAVQNFYAAGLASQFVEVDRFIRDKITRLHLGEWTGLLREVLRCFAERQQDLVCRELFLLHFRRFGANPTPQGHFTDQGAAGRLLTLRNALAHGATLPDEESTALLQEHENDLRTLLDKADFFTAQPLYHIEAETAAGTFQVRLLMGADYRAATPLSVQAAALPLGHVVVHNPQTEAFLDLHPLLVCTECLEQVPQWDASHRLVGKAVCRQPKVLFYNDLKAEDCINFLDYWRGHHSRFKSPHPMAGEFRAHFPKLARPTQKAQWFDDFILYHTEHFVGRKPDLDDLSRFAMASPKRVMVVVAAPGMGKSALLARWAAEHQAIRHFIREGDAATYDTVRIFENLARQLSERFQVEWKPPASLEPAAYRQAFEEILKAAAGTGHVVVVVDGLDEAVRGLTRGKGMEAVPTMVDWLPDPALLPDGVRFILSIRPELLEHAAFAAKFGQDKAEHLELDRMTDADVRALLYQVRSKYEVLAAQEYIDAIVQRSEGSPLYLRMLLEDLSEERLTFGQIEELPPGVVDYFERLLKFMEGEGRTRETPDVEPLLQAKRETYAVVVALGRMTPEEVEAALERERAALEGRAGVKSIELLSLYCLAREPLVLPDAAAILEAEPVEIQRAFEVIRTVLVDDGQGRFAVFHTGFREYFLHLDEYTETRLHRHAETVGGVRDAALAWCARWPEHRRSYALRHFAAHLYEAARWDELYALARNEAFLHAQTQALTGDPHAPLQVLQTALRGAQLQDDAVRMAEFMLTHARRLIKITQESPLDALRAGQLERAWKLADLYDIERCALWHLLLAWELKGTSSLEDSWATIERIRRKDLPQLHGWKSEFAAQFLTHTFDVHEVALAPLHERLLDVEGRIAFGQNRVEVLGKIAVAQVQAGEAEAACSTLAAVLETAQGIRNAKSWAEVLAAIAVAQVQAGEAEAACSTLAAALETVQRYMPRQFQAEALAAIAVAQAQVGEVEAARATLAAAFETWQRYTPGVSQAEVLAAIAVAQAQAGEADAARATFAAALKAAQGIRPDLDRAWVLRAIVVAQVQAGEAEAARATFAIALETTRGIRSEEGQVNVLRRIAVAQLQAGEADAARTAFAVALERTGGIEGAASLAQMLRRIAVVQVQAGEAEAARATFAAAIRTARGIEEAASQAEALGAIAVAQAQAGEADAARTIFAAALRTTREIKEEWSHVKALGAIAVAQVQAGEAEAARATFATGLKVAQQYKPRQFQAEALAAIAVAQVQAGEVDAALRTTRGIKEESSRAEALGAIAVAQAQAGEAEAARATLAAALGVAQWYTLETLQVNQAEALGAIAVAQAQAGEADAACATFAAALDAAQGIRSDMFRMGALAATAVAQAQAGEFAAARQSAQAIQGGVMRADALRDIAVTQAQAGFGEQAVRTADLILTNRDTHLPEIATTLGKLRDQENLKRLLLPCSYSLEAAYRMWELLPLVYPEQAREVAAVVQANMPTIARRYADEERGELANDLAGKQLRQLSPPEHAVQLNMQYQQDLARWQALPWWKSLMVKKPTPPAGI